MRKLYRRGSVHPSPPLKPDHLSFLPPAILTLTVALSPQDREVLAYLISCSSSSNFSGNNRRRNTATATANSTHSYSNNSGISGGVDHPPSFDCYCFRCYMSYWARWDSSPNRQLIHEIIDAYEDGLSTQSKKEKSRKDRRKGGKGSAALKRSEPTPPSDKELTTESSDNSLEDEIVDTKGSGEADDGGEVREGGEMEKSSVRRFVSFLGEKIWGGWTQN